MSDRERWIVYPLLVFALLLGLRGAGNSRVRCRTVECENLEVTRINGAPYPPMTHLTINSPSPKQETPASEAAASDAAEVDAAEVDAASGTEPAAPVGSTAPSAAPSDSRPEPAPPADAAAEPANTAGAIDETER